MSILIRDRGEAGVELARELMKYRKRGDVIVLALPRGGVPVAAEIARALHAPLDLMIVRELGTPGQEELAMGAIASGGARVLNWDIITLCSVTDEAIERVTTRERIELERRMRAYRGKRPWADLEGKRVILVDDGLATGATMRAAIAAVRLQKPAKIVVAVPVAPCDTLAQMHSEADEVACLATPEPFHAIGAWYASFPQLSDDEVRGLLAERWEQEQSPAHATAVRPPGRAHDPRDESAPHEARELAARPFHSSEVVVDTGDAALEGLLTIPGPAHGLVVFVHGSGSTRFSIRNRHVAECLNGIGFGTLLFDLLSAAEQEFDKSTGELRFDIGLLTRRLTAALEWAVRYPATARLPIGLFGASTGVAAALNVAACRPHRVSAIVSRGGRPDLAEAALARVTAPTLLIVGALDVEVRHLNREAAAALRCEHRLEIVPGATHLFEEPGKLEEVARLARNWFEQHLRGVSATRASNASAPV